jgi:hypothetical protein
MCSTDHFEKSWEFWAIARLTSCGDASGSPEGAVAALLKRALAEPATRFVRFLARSGAQHNRIHR